MTTTQRTWNNDFANVSASLKQAGHVRTLDDGFQYVDDAAGTMGELYRSLLQVGYAKGWI